MAKHGNEKTVQWNSTWESALAVVRKGEEFPMYAFVKWLIVLSSICFVVSVTKSSVAAWQMFSSEAAVSAGRGIGNGLGTSIGYGMGSRLLDKVGLYGYTSAPAPAPAQLTNAERVLEIMSSAASISRFATAFR